MPTNEKLSDVVNRVLKATGAFEYYEDDDYAGFTFTKESAKSLDDIIEPNHGRTCHVDKHLEERGGRYVWVYTFSCGHEFESYWYMNPRYCPFCGEKVVNDAY